MKSESKNDLTENLKNTAKVMAVNCVRNTVIEDYHAGTTPRSKKGDFSDVKVVTPYGEIPWNKLSRINDVEMKTFNKEVVNKLYTYLEFLINPEFEDGVDRFMELSYMMYPHDWDEPELDKGFMTASKRNKK